MAAAAGAQQFVARGQREPQQLLQLLLEDILVRDANLAAAHGFFHNSRVKQFFVTTVPPQLDSSQIAKIDHGFLQKPAAFLCFCPPPAPWTAHRASLLHQRVRARTGALPRWLPRGSCIHAFPFQAPSTPRSVCHPALPIRHVCGLLEHSREAVRMLMICCRSSTLLLCWLHRSRADQFQKP